MKYNLDAAKQSDKTCLPIWPQFMTDCPQFMTDCAVLRGCIESNPARKIYLIISHISRYLSVNWDSGCELILSKVWLLTLMFIGGSGGEGSAERGGWRNMQSERAGGNYHQN